MMPGKNNHNDNSIRKRPWNRVDSPVYSISSLDASGNGNMHIITYVTAVSMFPKRYICGVFKGTKTLANLQDNKLFVLQLLADDQYPLVKLLGRTSGHDADKISQLTQRSLLRNWRNFPVLQDCLSLLEMKIINSMDGGDHMVLLCDVLSYKNLRAGNSLTIDLLRKRKLVRM